MATDDVRSGRREAFPLSAEEEARLSVANELSEESGNRRVKVNLTKAPFFVLSRCSTLP